MGSAASINQKVNHNRNVRGVVGRSQRLINRSTASRMTNIKIHETEPSPIACTVSTNGETIR